MKTLLYFQKPLTVQKNREIFVIRDKLRAHHSKPVKQRLAANAYKIEVFYPMPPKRPGGPTSLLL